MSPLLNAARRPKKAKKSPQVAPQAAARDAFRASIAAAAERAFVAKGFASLKMVDIAAEAGVGVGTIYNYFADKQAVFEAIFEARTEEFHALLDHAIEGKSGCAQIDALIRTSLAYLEQHGALVAMFHERGAVGEFDVERLGGEVMVESYRRFLRQLESAIAEAAGAGELRKDIPPASLVAALAGARNGAIYLWIIGRSRERLTLLADHVLALFYGGARLQS